MHPDAALPLALPLPDPPPQKNRQVLEAVDDALKSAGASPAKLAASPSKIPRAAPGGGLSARAAHLSPSKIARPPSLDENEGGAAALGSPGKGAQQARREAEEERGGWRLGAVYRQ